LNEKIKWEYAYSQVLSEVVDAYKKEHKDERIQPSKREERGKVNVYDVEQADIDEAYVKTVNAWALAVYESYRSGHQISKDIADKFKERMNFKTISK
jgi:DNA relaxase NicK